MSQSNRVSISLGFAAAMPLMGLAWAQTAPTNSLSNPYRSIENWAKMPEGRVWGSTSGVDVDRDGKRGIRIGSAKDGSIAAFIPDPVEKATTTSAAEGVTVDAAGNIYGAEVGPKRLMKYVRN